MKSSFPNSSQFSPIQTPLPDLLAIVKENQPDRPKIKDAIAAKFFPGSTDSKIPENTIYALSEYLLLEKPKDNTDYATLTSVGELLTSKAKEENLAPMYHEFARHILLKLRGLDLVQCTQDLTQRDVKLTKQTIAKELTYRGFHVPRNGTHLNGMRQWFEMAGLVEPGKWEVNQAVLKHLLGQVDSVELDTYAQLSSEQKAFALAFARLNTDVALSNKVASYASALYGVEFPDGGLPQSTLFALQNAGLITCEKTTSGQGAKPYLVRPTEKLKNEFLEPIFQAMEKSTGIQYRKLIRMPLSDILDGLEKESKHEKGLALEALAFYVSRLIDLQFVKWRLRSSETGGAELDVIMESANLLFSRWQIQCKNSAHATLDDIAKEVGLATIIKSNVIMIVTTGTIGDKAKAFAAEVMRETNHQVILLQKGHLKRLKADPTEISDMLRSQSEDAMSLKRSQLDIVGQPQRMKFPDNSETTPDNSETTIAAFQVQARAAGEARQSVQGSLDLGV